jgi:predicted Zn finger-like uncharacterized protein
VGRPEESSVIASCPQCQTRYRLAREKIGPQGARIRCSQCQTIFRVQAPPEGSPATPAEARPSPVAAPPPPPPAPKPLPPLARALIAEVDADAAKGAAEILALWRIEAEVVDDGGEALVRMFRTPPALAILGVELPSLRASRIAEVCQRASELAAVKLVRIASSSDQSGTAGFDSEEMLEAGDYPAGLPAILGRLGLLGNCEGPVMNRHLEVDRAALAARIDEPRFPVVVHRHAPLGAWRP